MYLSVFSQNYFFNINFNNRKESLPLFPALPPLHFLSPLSLPIYYTLYTTTTTTTTTTTIKTQKFFSFDYPMREGRGVVVSRFKVTGRLRIFYIKIHRFRILGDVTRYFLDDYQRKSKTPHKKMSLNVVLLTLYMKKCLKNLVVSIKCSQ